MKTVYLLFALLLSSAVYAQDLLIEAESFDEKGGWLVDPQFVEQMGSSYLLAHGMGKPVYDASTNFRINKKGKYHIWVRTKNWASGDWVAPGRFQLQINERMFCTAKSSFYLNT